MKIKTFKYILFLFLAGALFSSPFYLPFLQERNPKIQAEDLSGSFERVQSPFLSGRNWLSKKFQKDLERNRKQESSITPLFVRGKNELDYQLFNHINTKRTLAGKNGFLYSNEYCESYIGKDFLGESKIKTTVDKLKLVCDSLNKIGILCLIINPPGKPRARPEYLPDFYQNYPTTVSNWEVFNKETAKAKIPLLDLNFLLNPVRIDSTEIPLYPTLGLHWNYLGAVLVTNELNDLLTKKHGFLTRAMSWDLKFKMSEEMLGTDVEMMHGSNLLSDLKTEKMPYPNVEFESETPEELPNALVIGDSYYKIIYDYGMHDGIFDRDSDFFYYYRQRFPKRKENPRSLSVHETLKDRDLIIFSHSEFNLDDFGFGFLDRLYDYFTQSPSTKSH